MKAKLIYESQGVDEDVAQRARDIATRIRCIDYRLRKTYEPSEDTSVTRSVCIEWMRVPDPTGGADLPVPGPPNKFTTSVFLLPSVLINQVINLFYWRRTAPMIFWCITA